MIIQEQASKSPLGPSLPPSPNALTYMGSARLRRRTRIGSPTRGGTIPRGAESCVSGTKTSSAADQAGGPHSEGRSSSAGCWEPCPVRGRRLRGRPRPARGPSARRPARADRRLGWRTRSRCRGGPRRARGGAGKGVLVQVPGRLHLPQRAQVVGEVGRRGQGVGVVLAEHPAAPGQGVLVQVPGGPISPRRAGRAARLLAEARVLGWSSPSTRRQRSRVSWSRSRAA